MTDENELITETEVRYAFERWVNDHDAGLLSNLLKLVNGKQKGYTTAQLVNVVLTEQA